MTKILFLAFIHQRRVKLRLLNALGDSINYITVKASVSIHLSI